MARSAGRQPESTGSPGSARAGRILVGVVGYRNLQDYSAGPLLLERLRRMDWPPGVEVEDLSFGPIAAVHWLKEQDPPVRTMVLVGAVDRGFPPGHVHRYAWRHVVPDAHTVQAAVEEAGAGVISLPNLLVVCEQFGALPPRVEVMEIQPFWESWGEDLSEPVARSLDKVLDLVHRMVQDMVL